MARNRANIEAFEDAIEDSGDSILTFEIASLYIDFINIFLVIAGIRNGTQLEFALGGRRKYVPDKMCADLIRTIQQFPNLRAQQFGTRAIIVWNSRRVTDQELAYSWATNGNIGLTDPASYFANTGKLLGTPYGYPSFSEDPATSGYWNIEVTISFQRPESNEATKRSNSLCGGIYNTANPDDLRGVRYILDNVTQIVGMSMPYPFLDVKIVGVELTVIPPVKRRKTRGRRRGKLQTRRHK